MMLGEQLGFESACLAAAVFYSTRPLSNPLMVAIAAAQRTARIRFGTLAAQAPMRHSFTQASTGSTVQLMKLLAYPLQVDTTPAEQYLA
jgi:alkanesulfonate monooxygenase SsuD/methylene tetrahydromethanopterin reductase-like flavin-dependent oxidoreductase (luciferase family)